MPENVKDILTKVQKYGISNSLKRVSNKFLKRNFPAGINVEIMTICNLRCKHCRVTYHGGLIPGVKLGMMEFDLFKKIIDRISLLVKRANVFQFSTIEPLFHKRIFEMMDYVSQFNTDITYPLLSNGMLLDEGKIRNLSSRNVPSVAISLDGCKKKTVESFKTGMDFDKVVNNIRLLKRIAGKKIKVSTVFVATSLNVGELIDYVDFCSDLGVDCIFVNGFLSYLPESSNLCLYSKTGNTKIYELFVKAYEKAKERGISILFPSLTAKPMGCECTSCLCIDESGNVSPCIHLARKTPFALFSNITVASPVIYGNILNDDPLSVWNKKEYVDFRKKLKRSEIPNECALCADAYGVICSNKKLAP